MVASPRVVRSAVRSQLEGAAEIGQSKRSDLGRNAQLDGELLLLGGMAG